MAAAYCRSRRPRPRFSAHSRRPRTPRVRLRADGADGVDGVRPADRIERREGRDDDRPREGRRDPEPGGARFEREPGDALERLDDRRGGGRAQRHAEPTAHDPDHEGLQQHRAADLTPRGSERAQDTEPPRPLERAESIPLSTPSPASPAMRTRSRSKTKKSRPMSASA